MTGNKHAHKHGFFASACGLLQRKSPCVLGCVFGYGFAGLVLATALVPTSASAQFFNRPPAPVQGQGYGNQAYGNGAAQGGAQTGAPESADDANVMLHIDRLENQMRALTGQVEELQFQLRQSQDQLKKFQGDVEFRFQELGKGGGGSSRAPQRRTDVLDSQLPQGAAGSQTTNAVASSAVASGAVASGAATSGALVGAVPQPTNPSAQPGAQNYQPIVGASVAGIAVAKRGDAFDPSLSPAAPGAPQPLGSSRSASQPLNLTGSATVTTPASAPPPQPASPAVIAAVPPAVAASPDGTSARDAYTGALNAFHLGQYDLAESGFKSVIAGNPNERLAPDAYFFLGETYFQRSQMREAAENYLKVTTDYAKSLHAPEAMLRLGITLAALGAHQQACATLGDLPTKFPSAPPGVKQAAVREHQHQKC